MNISDILLLMLHNKINIEFLIICFISILDFRISADINLYNKITSTTSYKSRYFADL
jgi:hypothetical protein